MFAPLRLIRPQIMQINVSCLLLDLHWIEISSPMKNKNIYAIYHKRGSSRKAKEEKKKKKKDNADSINPPPPPAHLVPK